MDFILEQLRMLGTVAVVMICALGGTVLILKLIRRFTPGDGVPKDPIAKRLEELQDKED